MGNLIHYVPHNFILNQKRRISYRLTLSVVGHIEFVFYCIQIYTKNIQVYKKYVFLGTFGSIEVEVCLYFSVPLIYFCIHGN